jgi:DHA1 family tetracycline resistance protein-like MFS transporter
MTPVAAAAIVVFCEGFVLWSVFPVLNFYCESLGVGGRALPLWVGALLFLQSAPRIVFNPLIGRLSDRFGRGPMMVVASVGTMFGSVVFAIAPNVWWLAASRLLAGVFGAQATLSAAVVADHTPPQRRTAAMGILGAAFGLSMVLGPLVAGVIARAWSHGAIGWVAAAFQTLAVAAAVVFSLGAPGGEPAARRATAASATWGSLLARGGVALLLGAAFLMTITQLQTMSTFATFAQQVYRFDEQMTGYAFALLGLVAVVAQGGLVRAIAPRIGDRRMGLIGLASLAGGGLVLAAAPPAPVLMLALVLLGMGGALCMPALTTLAANSVEPRDQGAMQGALQGVFALGRSIGSPLGGGLVMKAGFGPTYVFAAVLSIIAAFLLARARFGRADAAAAVAEPLQGEL